MMDRDRQSLADQLAAVMAQTKNDPFIQFLEKERAAGREYGDSPEFMRAVEERRMKPYPGAPPGTMSIDGVAPPPIDWNELIKSIPPNVYMGDPPSQQAPLSPPMAQQAPGIGDLLRNLFR